MKKHIWMVNHHALIPSKDGSSGRHVNMARYLPLSGWTASIIVASTLHPDGSQGMTGARLRRISDEDGIPVLWVRAYAYGSSMLRRFAGMLMFAMVLVVPGMTKGLQKPDVVMGSTVHLLGAWAGWRLARRNRVPFVYEIRDVWPDTLIHLGKLNAGGILSNAMEWLSVYLAKRAKLVVSPLPNIDRYLIDHGVDDAKFLWVSNGFEGAPLSPTEDESSTSEFVFMYLGSHGIVNALDGIIEAFDQACSELDDGSLRLRFVGSGPLKPELIESARSLSSSKYITFEDQIPQSEVIKRAQESDCLVANMHDNPVYRYGISPNKLFTYMYARRPVLFGCSQDKNPISISGGGIVVSGDNRKELAKAMVDIVNMSDSLRENMASKGYEHVITNYSYETLSLRLSQGLDSICAPPQKLNK